VGVFLSDCDCFRGNFGTSGGRSGGHLVDSRHQLTVAESLFSLESSDHKVLRVSTSHLKTRTIRLEVYKMRFFIEFAGLNIQSVYRLLRLYWGVADPD
jgi:hypothetical protein